MRGLGLEGKVALYKTSHVGGHKYAGNVIVYPPGDWLGYVTPERFVITFCGTSMNTI